MKTKIKKKFFIIFIIIFFVITALMGLIFFGTEKHKNKKNTLVTKESKIQPQWRDAHETLYFKGELKPIHVLPILSPLDGTVVSMEVSYGAKVNKGQALLHLAPLKLEEDFRQALSQFLQKKAAFSAQETKFAGDKALFKVGAIARQEFDSAKDAYGTALMDFNQARSELEKLLPWVQVSADAIERLSLSDTKEVSRWLKQSFAPLVITAPVDGVVLWPSKNLLKAGGGAEAGGQSLSPGVSIKAQDPLVLLGDLSGFEVDVLVNERQVAALKPGLSARVTGEAFEGLALDAVVDQVAMQSDPNSAQGGGQGGMFNVVLRIPTITEAAREALRIGMSAKVAIELSTKHELVLPIAAVVMKHSEPWVTKVDDHGHSTLVRVVTGRTDLRDVVIESGLAAGDWVMVSNVEVPE
jgi:multidrug efflux pump subunit AcrA (membrane-fusion protein)